MNQGQDVPGKKKKPDHYYQDGRELGLVGIGWWEWAEAEFLKFLPPHIRTKLEEAIRHGLQGAYPTAFPLTAAETRVTFPTDRVAVLAFGGLEVAEAEQLLAKRKEVVSKQEHGANQVALFLTARVGDIVVTRDTQGNLHCGLFAARASSIENLTPRQLKPLGVGGHICRPVTWIGNAMAEKDAARWLEGLGFSEYSKIVDTFNGTLMAYNKVGGGSRMLHKFFEPSNSNGPDADVPAGGGESTKGFPLRDLLRRSKTVILEGVPGTGKTYAIKNEICRVKYWESAAGKRELGGKGDGHYAITLHPATSYEDFVEGLRPVAGQDSGASSRPGPSATPKPVLIDSGEQRAPCDKDHLIAYRYFHAKLDDIHNAEPGRFAVQDGFFLRVCAKAVNNPEKDYVVLLDEFNRCNVPKVMGDLLTTMERSKRAEWHAEKNAWDLRRCQVVTLPASKRLFFVPENVYVVATMNSTDRSVAPLDSALRRRFAFHRCWPLGFGPQDNRTDEGDKGNQNEVTDEKAKVEKARVERVVTEAKEKIGKDDGSIKAFNASVEAWVKINTLLLKAGGPDALLGHSYLMDLADDLGKLSGVETDGATPHLWVEHHWNHHILPQLADVLVTHSLESLLETKAAEAGEILKIKVGERRIVQPAETVRDGRGQYGTLVLRLDERVLTAERKKPGKTPKRKDWTLPNVLGEDQIGSGFCGIRFSTSSGTGADTRKHVINSFWGKLKDPTCPRPLSFWFAKEGEFGKEQIAEVAEGTLDVKDYQLKIEERAADYGQGHFGYPWACYFRSEDLKVVEKLIEELRGDAPSA
jgi:hypothetical protein